MDHEPTNTDVTRTTRAGKVERFRALHVPSSPLVMPNAWDVGSARVLQSLGFQAIATTSSGFALTLGRRDYGVTREESLAHCRALCGAVEIPVSADLENGFGRAPEHAAETIMLAAATGLAGGSIEDSTGDREHPVFDSALAIERVAAAVEAARGVEGGFVLTARAEAFLYGDRDLDALIARLQAFAKVGADVLFAPGLPDLTSVRAVCAAVDKPVSVLPLRELSYASVAELGEAGAARLSTGGLLAVSAYAMLADFAARLTQQPFSVSPELGKNIVALKKHLA